MTGYYHRLLYVPDLCWSTRFDVGAVVVDGKDLIWVPAQLTPPLEFCSTRGAWLLDHVLRTLPQHPSGALPYEPFPEDAIERRPGSYPPRLSNLGNHFHTEQPRPLPPWSGDPVAWLQEHCLPRRKKGDPYPPREDGEE